MPQLFAPVSWPASCGTDDAGVACELATLSSVVPSSSDSLFFLAAGLELLGTGVPARFLGRGVGVLDRPGGRPLLLGVAAGTGSESSSRSGASAPFSGTLVVVVRSRRRTADAGPGDANSRRRPGSSAPDWSASTVTRILWGETSSPTSSWNVCLLGEAVAETS